MESPRIQWLFIPQDQMSELLFSIHWNPGEVGSNVSERKDLLRRPKQARKEQKLPS